MRQLAKNIARESRDAVKREQQAPVAETQEPVAETQEPVVEEQAPVVEEQAPVVEGDVDLRSMKRSALNEYAVKLGVDSPQNLPNKDAVVSAIEEILNKN